MFFLVNLRSRLYSAGGDCKLKLSWEINSVTETKTLQLNLEDHFGKELKESIAYSRQ
jgi:hypothetical protein